MGTPDRCADWLRALTSVEVRRSILVRFVSYAQRVGAAELSDPCRHSSNADSTYCGFSLLRTQTDAYHFNGYL
ncbi:MAG: hypothetical protein ACI9FZ_000488 [Bacteroidia bacterium]|jgi:hypothetical protein